MTKLWLDGSGNLLWLPGGSGELMADDTDCCCDSGTTTISCSCGPFTVPNEIDVTFPAVGVGFPAGVTLTLTLTVNAICRACYTNTTADANWNYYAGAYHDCSTNVTKFSAKVIYAFAGAGRPWAYWSDEFSDGSGALFEGMAAELSPEGVTLSIADCGYYSDTDAKGTATDNLEMLG